MRAAVRRDNALWDNCRSARLCVKMAGLGARKHPVIQSHQRARRASCASGAPEVTTSMQAPTKLPDDLPQVVGVLFDNPQGFL